MWVCLRVNKNISVHGTMMHYHQGDWIQVGKQLGREWISAGDAYTLDPQAVAQDLDPTAGLVIRGTVSETWRAQMEQVAHLHVAFVDETWNGELPFTESLIWANEFELRLDLLLVGFNLLKRWQIAIPLLDYTTLAAHIGTEAERARTEAVIRDLRVPVRDTRLIFVRRCEDTRRVMHLWRDSEAGNEQLAWLRAVYTVKPVVCDLPASWTGRQ